MGLDTRAYAKATDEWKQAWADNVNTQGYKVHTFGLLATPIGKANHGLAGGFLDGIPPVTVDDAPSYHQDGLENLTWPGGLVGGMISSNGSGPSFRGKVYDDYVETVTGRSLYEPLETPWEGDDLLHVTLQLEIAVTSPPAPVGFDEDERRALAEWFRVCVDNQLVVSGDA